VIRTKPDLDDEQHTLTPEEANLLAVLFLCTSVVLDDSAALNWSSAQAVCRQSSIALAGFRSPSRDWYDHFVGEVMKLDNHLHACSSTAAGVITRWFDTRPASHSTLQASRELSLIAVAFSTFGLPTGNGSPGLVLGCLQAVRLP